MHASVGSQMEMFREQTPEGALVVRLGETGLETSLAGLFQRKQQRMIVIASENPYPENRAYLRPWPVMIDMGFAFGDACVPLSGYPIRILPASGVMQVAAYECLNVGVLARWNVR